MLVAKQPLLQLVLVHILSWLLKELVCTYLCFSFRCMCCRSLCPEKIKIANSLSRNNTSTIHIYLDTIGELSCNPSIGGIGKGHLVREIDALDGLIGKVADQSGIHFKMLNQRKGAAVQGPRLQADRDMYKSVMIDLITTYPNIEIIQESVEDLLIRPKNLNSSSMPESMRPKKGQGAGYMGNRYENDLESGSVASMSCDNEVYGIRTRSGTEIYGSSVVITTGTFLRGTCFIGLESYPAGRHMRTIVSGSSVDNGLDPGMETPVEAPSIGLALTLDRLKFPLGRLKTGTPPRIYLDSINWEYLKKNMQSSDPVPIPFSYMHMYPGHEHSYIPSKYQVQDPSYCIEANVPKPWKPNRLVQCGMTRTTPETHAIVMENEHLLPHYDGKDGDGIGPRYCPSLHMKVKRFPEKDTHLIWLEPEGIGGGVVDTGVSKLIYPQGLSGPFPKEIQVCC